MFRKILPGKQPQTGNQIDKQADNQADKQAGNQADKQVGNQTDKQVGNQADRKAKQTERNNKNRNRKDIQTT